MMTGAEVIVTDFEGGRRDHEPRNAGSNEGGKGKETDSPRSIQKECSPTDTLISPP